MCPYVTKRNDKVETALVQSVGDDVFSCNVLVLILGKSYWQERVQGQRIVVPVLQYPPSRVDLWEQPFNRPVELAQPKEVGRTSCQFCSLAYNTSSPCHIFTCLAKRKKGSYLSFQLVWFSFRFLSPSAIMIKWVPRFLACKISCLSL